MEKGREGWVDRRAVERSGNRGEEGVDERWERGEDRIKAESAISRSSVSAPSEDTIQTRAASTAVS